ncbi:DUF4166 domain-containing protein [Leucobacter sp. W1153]|uniref:DUF4166 domain-containing protein n=1 Tax=Leucobacter sp. W1153 TaxID=3439064 RepID=UPI003F38715C
MTPNTGIFQRALGADFDRLHPEMQRRFGVGIDAGYSCVGRGTMLEIRRGKWWTVPFLAFGAIRNIMFPDAGTGFPFQIDNYVYRDGYGRETVTFVRTVQVSPRKRRRFDATMIFSEQRECVVDYLGTHQHLAVDLGLTVTPEGGLRLISGAQRFYEGPIAFRFPLLFSGVAQLTEHFDEEKQRFVIDLEVRNRVLGMLFGYRAEFECDYPDAVNVPATVKPYREEQRE